MTLTKTQSTISPIAHNKKRMGAKCRNEYQRKMQRIYRRAEAEERRRLRMSVVMLESCLSMQKNLQMVSWKDTAQALAEDLESAVETNHQLRAQIQEQYELNQFMYTYLSTMTDKVSQLEPWQYQSLPCSNAARKITLQWITQQMYENTNVMIQMYPFPTLQNYANVAVIDNTLVLRYQRILPLPVDVVTQAYTANSLSFPHHGEEDLDAKLLDPSLVYRRRDIGNVNTGPIPQNFVQRQFVNADSSIVVSRNVLNDDKHPMGSLTRDVAGWAIARAHGYNTTIVQEIWTMSTLLSHMNVANSDVQAAFYGFKCADSKFVDIYKAMYNEGEAFLNARSVFLDSIHPL
ncbi:hypothetical protein THRCLA_04884 [Thraustotheca clavata]|uniref:Uncharacterized protein n=1 Tax=Thraustotheca clavata TaxID=74557 RepID=A0A1V9ZXT4_9STRA|nr:hypothetical protein THRCLA_04884 [Thraustotheca clavata]